MRWGFEAEFGLVDASGALVDFTHPRMLELQQIVDGLPDHADDDLTRGDLAIKWSRWYVEGDERFDEDGAFLRCVAKGIETRTPVADGVPAALASLGSLVAELETACAGRGLRLTAIGHNPVHAVYEPRPAFNVWERAMRAEHAEYDAPEVYMSSYGPDLNLSDPSWTAERSLEVAARLAAWAPEIVAFSLNAPFVDGAPYGGLSYRTAVRAGRRPTVRLFLGDQGIGRDQGIRRGDGTGLTVRPARIPQEAGRIEFKALDAFAELDRFAAHAALVGGLARADDAPEPSACGSGGGDDPADRLRAAAARGFEDEALAARCAVLLDLAREGWAGAADADALDVLADQLDARTVPAHGLLAAYEATGVIPLPTVTGPAPR